MATTFLLQLGQAQTFSSTSTLSLSLAYPIIWTLVSLMTSVFPLALGSGIGTGICLLTGSLFIEGVGTGIDLVIGTLSNLGFWTW